jgi:2,3-bisphosphoglycerate-independent phosphoglycerate mutase
MPAMPRPKPVILAILDGFGVAPSLDGNAVREARMPVMQGLIESYPAMTLQASGMAVGLSWGEMGNSEVGHLTIGAGRVFYQSLPRVNVAIESGEFFRNNALLDAIKHARSSNGTLHLMGLVSQGGVHSRQEHLYALLELCQREDFNRVAVHAFLDGRDTAYNGGEGFIAELEAKMKELKVGRIASVCGRFWAMDRDNRWERVQKAYDAIANGVSDVTYATAHDAIAASYAANVFDEEFVPTVLMEKGKPVATVNNGDACIFFNFRPDRARQLTQAFAVPDFSKFQRRVLDNLFFTTLMEYEKGLPVHVAYPPQMVETCLARVIADAGLKQLHIAETEKYAHVTFFLNGMRELEFNGEDRVIIPSPPVSSYDQAPEMSAIPIAERVVKEIAASSYDAILVNFANPDMVGHTGNEPATVAACEAVDKALGMIVEATLAVGGVLLITADHGNAEEVKNLTTGEIDKEHSTNPVPFIVVGRAYEGMKAPTGDVVGGDLSMTQPVGMLADVAPTILKIMNLPLPPDMTGRPLV